MTAADCGAIPSGSSKPPSGLIGSILMGPPAWLMHLATLAAMIGLLDAFSAPGCYTEEGIVFALLWLLLIAIWCVRLLAVFLAGQRLRRWQWTVTPIIGAVTVA